MTRKRASTGCAPLSSESAGYDSVVSAYISEFRDSATRERRYFARFRDLSSLIEAAALSEYPRGKRHHHQRRISGSVLRKAADRLLSVEPQVARCSSFEDLHDLVCEVIGGIHGIGALAAYDIATRVGAFLGLEPAYVFVHAGVIVGARALGFVGQKRIVLDELPAAFQVLSPAEAEDCLCIYKRQLQDAGRTSVA